MASEKHQIIANLTWIRREVSRCTDPDTRKGLMAIAEYWVYRFSLIKEDRRYA
jgi:hypothetical protein